VCGEDINLSSSGGGTWPVVSIIRTISAGGGRRISGPIILKPGGGIIPGGSIIPRGGSIPGRIIPGGIIPGGIIPGGIIPGGIIPGGIIPGGNIPGGIMPWGRPLGGPP
jgi:hypothetical protein